MRWLLGFEVGLNVDRQWFIRIFEMKNLYADNLGQCYKTFTAVI